MDKTKINSHFKTWISGLCSLALLPAGLMIASAANEGFADSTPPGGETIHNTTYGIVTGGSFANYQLPGARFAHRFAPTSGAVEGSVFVAGEGTPEALSKVSLVGLCQAQIDPLDAAKLPGDKIPTDRQICLADWVPVVGGSGIHNSLPLSQVDNKQLNLERYQNNQDEDERAGSVFFHVNNAIGDRAFYVVEVALGNDFYGRLRLPSTRIYDFSTIQAPGAQMDYVIKRDQVSGQETLLSWANYKAQQPREKPTVADPTELVPDQTEPSADSGSSGTELQVNPNPQPAPARLGSGAPNPGGAKSDNAGSNSTPLRYYASPADSNPAVGNGDSVSSSTLDLGAGSDEADQPGADQAGADQTGPADPSADQESSDLSAPKAPKAAKTSRSTSVLDRMGGLGTVAAIAILALIGTSGLIILIQSVLQQRREEEGVA